MLIIFKNVPETLNKYCLEHLIQDTLDSAFWLGRGKLKDIHILKAKNIKGTIVEFHCVALIEPEAAARRVMRILNGKPFNGMCLKVSEYVVRNWHNDRRQFNTGNSGQREVRLIERRRHLIFDSPRFL